MPSLTWIGKDAMQQLHRQIPYRLLRCGNALCVAARRTAICWWKATGDNR